MATGAPPRPQPADPAEPDGPPGGRPGWYPDPYDDRQRRRWDGERWTSHVEPPPGVLHGGQPGRLDLFGRPGRRPAADAERTSGSAGTVGGALGDRTGTTHRGTTKGTFPGSPTGGSIRDGLRRATGAPSGGAIVRRRGGERRPSRGGARRSPADRARTAAARSAAAEQRRKAAARRILNLGIAGFVLAAVMTVYGMARGPQTEPTVEDDVESYSSGAAVSAEVIQRRQPRMEERFAVLEGRARTEAGDDLEPSGTDLSGTWVGANGLGYAITQFGSEAVLQELTPFGLSATGYGMVDDGVARFEYQSVDGSAGVAELVVVDDRTLRGTFHNFSSGAESAVLRR